MSDQNISNLKVTMPLFNLATFYMILILSPLHYWFLRKIAHLRWKQCRGTSVQTVTLLNFQKWTDLKWSYLFALIFRFADACTWWSINSYIPAHIKREGQMEDSIRLSIGWPFRLVAWGPYYVECIHWALNIFSIQFDWKLAQSSANGLVKFNLIP